MNGINKTLYIPLYAKAYVSQKNLFLSDKKAEEIWEKEKFPLKGKAKSKWLCYFLGIRAAVFDAWIKEQLSVSAGATILHLGCGLDSRAQRIGGENTKWYDVDFEAVIAERKKYYRDKDGYRMLPGNLMDRNFLSCIPENDRVIVVMEGVSMYLPPDALSVLLHALAGHFRHISLLMDAYTPLAARMSRLRNPIHSVGADRVYGLESPNAIENSNLFFAKEHDLTPSHLIDTLQGTEKKIFRMLYAGKLSHKLYKLYEYTKIDAGTAAEK